MAKKTSITLRITGPDGQVHESSSELESVIVGSGAGAAVKISDPKVSNLHFMLKVEKSGQVTAIDLGSEHGTRFKDQVVKDPVTLRSGDLLNVGGAQVKVLFGDEATAEAPTEMVKMNGSHAGPPQAEERKKAPPPMPPRALAGTGKNSAVLFNDPLPPEATPADDDKVLQVALLWGDTLINVQHFADGVPVSIGEGPTNRFNVFSSGVGAQFVLAQGKGASAIVNVPPEAGLVVSRGGSTHKTREQLKAEGKLRASDGGVRADAVELGLHDRVQVSFESVAFIVRYVRPSAAVSVNTLDEADFTFFKIASVCLMALAALIAAIILTPGWLEGGAADDLFANPSKYVKMIVKAEKKVEVKKVDLSGIKEGAKPKDDEGKFGKKEEKKKDADPSKKGAPTVDVNKREEDRKKIAQAGLLGALNNGAASNVFGPGGLGTGINNALGGLQGGAGVGDAHGVGGMGSRGAGTGGGGTGLGLGGLGTKGGGRGAGGFGSIDLGGKGKDSTRIIPGKTTVVGGLSKDQINKVIKRHQNEIKFCYEQELQKTPDLSGKVAVLFTIDPAGGVAEANVSESTMGNSTAENCMLARIRRWKFPEPEGGGTVTVTYPWVFKPAGGAEGGEE
ncbi:MAG: TonB family protein [Myxococcaceae bacterium]|nr:TonB family protein [Myxococcaceae bacterium]